LESHPNFSELRDQPQDTCRKDIWSFQRKTPLYCSAIVTKSTVAHGVLNRRLNMHPNFSYIGFKCAIGFWYAFADWILH